MRKIFKFKEVIVLIITFASSIYFFKPEKIGFGHFTSKDLLIYSSLINIVALFIGLFIFSTLFDDFYLIKRKHGSFDNSNFGIDDLNSISKILNIPYDQARYFSERTSAVVGQLVRNISLFLWPLIIFYLINFTKDYLGLKPAHGFNTTCSFEEYCRSFPNDSHSIAFWYLGLSALANFFNFLSGIGLWVSFSILYQKTVDADNKSTLHLGVYYFLLTAYVLAYLILLGSGINTINIKNTILLLDLFCSIFNCVAMILFFNRLVQVLYFYQDYLKEKLLDKFYFFTATILLPLYACFQIFFAVFDQLVTGNEIHYQFIKGFVFFICFIGKIFLILFLYSFMKIKWLHAVIITLMVHESTPLLLAKSLKSISDSIGYFEDDLSKF